MIIPDARWAPAGAVIGPQLSLGTAQGEPLRGASTWPSAVGLGPDTSSGNEQEPLVDSAQVVVSQQVATGQLMALGARDVRQQPLGVAARHEHIVGSVPDADRDVECRRTETPRPRRAPLQCP